MVNHREIAYFIHKTSAMLVFHIACEKAYHKIDKAHIIVNEMDSEEKTNNHCNKKWYISS